MPRHKRETFIPVLPRLTYSILPPLLQTKMRIKVSLPFLQSLLLSSQQTLSMFSHQTRTLLRRSRTVVARGLSRQVQAPCDNRRRPSFDLSVRLPRPVPHPTAPVHIQHSKKEQQRYAIVDANGFSLHPLD